MTAKSEPIPCTRCGADLGPIGRRRAFLAFAVAGDEKVYSWFFCASCHAWTIEVWTDRFLGDSSVHRVGPIAEEDGRSDVALALTCPDAADARCDCPAHRRLGPR